MTATSSYVVENFFEIPIIEAFEIWIDLLVQKPNVHNFLRIPQSTFPLLQSAVQME